MKSVTSKITAQGQVSVPAEIRSKLGVGPGAMLEWVDDGGKVSVRRAGNYSSEDIHTVLFPDGPPKEKINRKQAIAKRMRERYARD